MGKEVDEKNDESFDELIDSIMGEDKEEPAETPADETPPAEEPVEASDEKSKDEGPKEESEQPPVVEDETTILRNQNAALLARLNALEAKALAPTPKSASAAGSEAPAPSAVAPGKPKFLTETDDIDDILSDREKLEGLLQRVYEQARNDALPQEYRNLPSFLGEQVQRQMVLREGIKEFFTENSDLLVVRQTVGAVTNEIVAEHPEWNLGPVRCSASKSLRPVRAGLVTLL